MGIHPSHQLQSIPCLYSKEKISSEGIRTWQLSNCIMQADGQRISSCCACLEKIKHHKEKWDLIKSLESLYELHHQNNINGKGKNKMHQQYLDLVASKTEVALSTSSSAIPAIKKSHSYVIILKTVQYCSLHWDCRMLECWDACGSKPQQDKVGNRYINTSSNYRKPTRWNRGSKQSTRSTVLRILNSIILWPETN